MSQITIEGNGAKITRKGNAPPFRLIAVGATGDLTLNNVTLTGGDAADYGGAIHNQGMLTIQNGTISDNNGRRGGGGGITNLPPARSPSRTAPFRGTRAVDRETTPRRRWGHRSTTAVNGDHHEQHDLSDNIAGGGGSTMSGGILQPRQHDRREQHHLGQQGATGTMSHAGGIGNLGTP